MQLSLWHTLWGRMAVGNLSGGLADLSKGEGNSTKGVACGKKQAGWLAGVGVA